MLRSPAGGFTIYLRHFSGSLAALTPQPPSKLIATHAEALEKHFGFGGILDGQQDGIELVARDIAAR